MCEIEVTARAVLYTVDNVEAGRRRSPILPASTGLSYNTGIKKRDGGERCICGRAGWNVANKKLSRTLRSAQGPAQLLDGRN